MRALPACALLAAAAVVLSGCSALVDIERRALVIGMGIDAAAAGAGYEVSLQYPAPSPPSIGGTGSAGGASAGGAMTFQTINSPGVSIGAAVERLREETDRFLYLGNLSVIAVGSTQAERGVVAPLDFFLRSGEVSESAQVVVTATTAAALLQQKAPEGVALPLFEYLSRAEIVDVPTSPTPLWRFLVGTYSAAHAAYAPVLAPSNQGQPFSATGTALFLRGRLASEVGGYQASVLDWLLKRRGFPDAVVTLPGAAGPVTLRVVAIRKRLQVLSPSAAVIHLRFEAYLREAPGLYLDDRNAHPLENDAAAQLATQVRGVLDILQRDGTDVVGLATRVHARYPDATLDWPAAFSRMHLGLDVSMRFAGGGRVA